MAKDKSIGISNKDNLAGWADHAKNNSYQCDKAALKDKLTSDKGAADTVNEARGPCSSLSMKVAAGRRRRPIRQTIPVPAQAAASGTEQRTLRYLSAAIGIRIVALLPGRGLLVGSCQSG